MRQDGEGVMLDFPTESQLLLVDLTDRDGEEGVFQVNSYIYLVPEDVWSPSSNETVPGTVGATGDTIWLSLLPSIIIL